MLKMNKEAVLSTREVSDEHYIHQQQHHHYGDGGAGSGGEGGGPSHPAHWSGQLRSSKGSGAQRTKRRTAKPMWAHTEHTAEVAEEDEVEELLEFADGLDFNSYIEDYEVRQALSLVKSRVKQLEARQKQLREEEVEIEEFFEELEPGEEEVPGVEYVTREGEDGVERRLRKVRREVRRPRYRAAAQGEDEEYLRTREEGWVDPISGSAAANRERVRHADRVLHSAHDLRGIHSKASLAAVMESANYTIPKPPPLPPMRRVNVEIVREDPPARKRELDPSQLPYLYRNPAI
jgi:hypothetical protein